MNVRYRVDLSQEERLELTALASRGQHAARKIKRAQILLAVDAGTSDDDIAAGVSVSGSTVYRTKRRFVEDDLEQALDDEPRPGGRRKLSAPQEALLVATASCSAFFTQRRSVSPVQPIFAAIEAMAARREA